MATHLISMNGLRTLHLLFLAALITSPAMAGSEIVGVASVTDGDTIKIHGTRIRLEGIDAPETRQTCETNGTTWRCGQRSALALADEIGRGTVRCEHLGTDRYQRVLGRCWKGSTNLNQWMVRNGWAVAYRRYSESYIADEDAARKSKVGMWAGSFDMPWDWRRADRAR